MGIHLVGDSSQVLEPVGEVAVEAPVLVIVPSVVPYEHFRSHVVLVIEFGFPLIDNFQTVRGLHVVFWVAGIITVYAKLVPRVVEGIGTPGHCTLALTISQERTALLTGSHDSHHGTHVPGLATLQSGGTAPEALKGLTC